METDENKTYRGKAYRYLSFDGLFKTIENKKLRFTRVDSFNDPLDNSILLAPWDWELHTKEGYDYIKFLQEQLQPKLTNSLYACCFCKEFETENSYLMWSHYGNCHTQVCFEIDFAQITINGGPSEVTYPESLKDARDAIKHKSKEEIGLYLVTTKKKQWKYEKEVRLIIDTEHKKGDPRLTFDLEDNKYIYSAIDLTDISKVIFGINSSKQNEEKTIQMLTENNVSPEYYKMVIDPPTLELKAIKYPL